MAGIASEAMIIYLKGCERVLDEFVAAQSALDFTDATDFGFIDCVGLSVHLRLARVCLENPGLFESENRGFYAAMKAILAAELEGLETDVIRRLKPGSLDQVPGYAAQFKFCVAWLADRPELLRRIYAAARD